MEGPSLEVRQKSRKVPSVPLPESRVLEEADLFGDGDVDIELLREHFRAEGKVSEILSHELCYRVIDLLEQEPNMLELKAPLSLFGDIHGQYYDLIANFDKLPPPSQEDPWLFLGDYVDRGSFGMEVVLYLFALKIKYPQGVFLLRGNHECRHLTSAYNFKKECLAKYKDEDLYDMIMTAFDALPIAALIDGGNSHRFLALHGGLSPDIFLLDDIQDLDRMREPPHSGPICDILWSDPLEDDTGDGLDAETMQEWYAVEFEKNPVRGCGYIFGYTATINFLERNQLTSIIRAHDVKRDGYHEHFMHSPQKRKFPLVITIFSAPNYCGYYENQGAALRLTPAEKNWGDAASPIDSAVTSPSLSPVSQRSRASSSLSSSHDVPVKMEPIPMASIPIDVLVSPRKLKKGGHQRVPSLHVEDILRKDGLLSPRYERASQFLSRPTEHHSAQLRSLVGSMKAMRKILREFRHAVIVEDTFPHFDLTHEPFSNEEHTYSAMGVIEDSDLTVNQLYETIASHMSEAERSLLSLGVNQEEYELMNVSDGELSEGESDSLPNSPPSSLLILSNESSSESPSLSPSLSPSFSPSDSIRSPRISTSLQRSLQRIPRLNLSPRAKDSTSESDEGEEEEDSSFLSSPESESNSTYSEKYFPSLHFIQYGWIESVPFWLPSFENAFQYSLPYVVDRLVDFMNTIRNMKVEISAPVTPQGSPVKPSLATEMAKTERVSEILSPRASPRSPRSRSGYVPLTRIDESDSDTPTRSGSVQDRISSFESHRRARSQRPLNPRTPAMHRRKSLYALAGTFNSKFNAYMRTAAQSKFDRIKKKDQVNEVRPPTPEDSPVR